MFIWIEQHGFEVLLMAYVLSMITNAMPALPIGKGWWIQWGYNVLKVVGANAKDLVDKSPLTKEFKGSSLENKPDGSQIKTDIAISSETTLPKT